MGQVVCIIMPQQRGANIGRLSRNFCFEFFSAAGSHVRKIERALKDLRLPARVHAALMREGRYDVAIDTVKRAWHVWDVGGELESSQSVSRPFSPLCETPGPIASFAETQSAVAKLEYRRNLESEFRRNFETQSATGRIEDMC